MQSSVHREAGVTRTLERGPIVLEDVACPRCGAGDSRQLHVARDYLYGVAGDFYVAVCSSCGLWFQNPRPIDKHLPLLYPETYTPHDSPALEGGAPSLIRRFIRAVNPIRWQHQRTGLRPKFVPEGRLLELGCASGARLLALRREGWKYLHGVELSAAAAQRAQAAGLDVRCERLEQALQAFPDAYFDVIVSSMVLEHLFNPFDVIRDVARKLKPGGQFLFSTIVRDSCDVRFYGRYWAGFDLPRHMVFLLRRDLQTALHSDFRDVMFRFQVAPIDYVRSSSWRIQSGCGSVFDRAVRRFGESVFAQLLCLGFAWLHVGCRVSVYCRRRSKTQMEVI